MSIIVIPLTLLFSALFVLLPVLIGVYVYRDANKRGMNGILWALVAALVPSLIGLIIYLLVRGNYSNLRCPRCDTPVTEKYNVCPKCGAKLRPTCPNCSSTVEPDWKVCPLCAEPLPSVQEDLHIPNSPKDRSLWKVLVVILLVPILLITLLFFGFNAFTTGGWSSIKETTIAEYEKEMAAANETEIAKEVLAWLDDLRPAMTLDHAYALRYDHETAAGKEYYYTVYVPGTCNTPAYNLSQSGGIFGTSLKLNLNRTGDDGGFFHLVSSADKTPKLIIKVDGKEIPCTVTEVDYNPTVFILFPPYEEPMPDSADIINSK